MKVLWKGLSALVLAAQLFFVLACGGGSQGNAGNQSKPERPTPPSTPLPATPSADFWDANNIPPVQNVMVFKFLNRTNGKYKDSEIFWKVSIDGVAESHSIADQPTFDMPANSSGRIYFYLGGLGSKYYDFIEDTIGPHQFNGNTTRVDAFGLKLAIKLHCSDGFESEAGEDDATFAEDRDATFQRFVSEAPAEFKSRPDSGAVQNRAAILWKIQNGWTLRALF